MTAALLAEFQPYGASELKRARRPIMMAALLLSTSFVTAVFLLASSLIPLIPPPRVVQVPNSPPPYSPGEFRVPTPAAPLPSAPRIYSRAPADAVPVPTADADVPDDAPGRGQEGEAGPVNVHPDGGARPTEDGSGDQPVNDIGSIPLVESLPVPVVSVKPIYPDLAREAMVDGMVLVHVLVGRDGRVREVGLDSRKHIPMLDPAALEAARQWSFEPALLNGRPVAVWVSIPFKFSLR